MYPWPIRSGQLPAIAPIAALWEVGSPAIHHEKARSAPTMSNILFNTDALEAALCLLTFRRLSGALMLPVNP